MLEIFQSYGISYGFGVRIPPVGVQAIFKILAQVAMRWCGVFNYGVLVARAHRNISVETWRRLALMIHDACQNLHSAKANC